MDANLVWHAPKVTPAERAAIKRQKPCVVWFTGLSGSGKSTIANQLEALISAAGHHTFLLDGDNFRHGLCSDLGFSPSDRSENLRRVGEVSKLLTDAGLIVLCAFISPFRSDRAAIRKTMGDTMFLEIFVDTPFSVCEERDPKGLYRKARKGEIQEFTGIDSPYEKPFSPGLILNTVEYSSRQCAEIIARHLIKCGAIMPEKQFENITIE